MTQPAVDAPAQAPVPAEESSQTELPEPSYVPLQDASSGSAPNEGAEAGGAAQNTPEGGAVPAAVNATAELQRRFDAGEALTTDESATLGRAQQSERDSARAEQNRREQRDQASRTRADKFEALPRALFAALNEKLDLDYDEGDPRRELAVREFDDKLGDVFDELDPLFTHEHQSAILTACTALAGEDAYYADRIGGVSDLTGAVNLYGELMHRQGQVQADTAGLAAENARLKVENEQLKAVRATGNGPGANSAARTSNTTPSPTYSTKEQARNLHATGKISDQAMRGINADPEIPEGYGG